MVEIEHEQHLVRFMAGFLHPFVHFRRAVPGPVLGRPGLSQQAFAHLVVTSLLQRKKGVRGIPSGLLAVFHPFLSGQYPEVIVAEINHHFKQVIHALLVLPVGNDENGRYPVLLDIVHPRPHAQLLGQQDNGKLVEHPQRPGVAELDIIRLQGSFPVAPSGSVVFLAQDDSPLRDKVAHGYLLHIIYLHVSVQMRKIHQRHTLHPVQEVDAYKVMEPRAAQQPGGFAVLISVFVHQPEL